MVLIFETKERMIRSETMNRYKIIIPKENAWEVLNELGMFGEVELIHTETPGSEMDKTTHRLVKHCEDILRCCNSVFEFLAAEGAPVVTGIDTDVYLSNLGKIIKQRSVQAKNYFEQVADEIKKYHEEVQRNSQMLEKLTEDLRHAEEELVVSLSLKEKLPESYM